MPSVIFRRSYCGRSIQFNVGHSYATSLCKLGVGTYEVCFTICSRFYSSTVVQFVGFWRASMKAIVPSTLRVFGRASHSMRARTAEWQPYDSTKRRSAADGSACRILLTNWARSPVDGTRTWWQAGTSRISPFYDSAGLPLANDILARNEDCAHHGESRTSHLPRCGQSARSNRELVQDCMVKRVLLAIDSSSACWLSSW